MKLLTITLFSCMTFGCADHAQAQLPDAAGGATDIQSVTIKGNKSAHVWSYRSLEAGLDVFERKQAELAPGASLRFMVRNYNDNGILAGATIKVLGEETDLSIPLAADGGFILPRSKSAHADKADVALALGADVAPSRKPGDFGTYPLPQVRSPNLPAGTWRMGDLRLECEATMAILKDTLSFVPRMALNALFLGKNFCARSGDPKIQGSVSFTAPAPYDSATLIDGERRLLLKREKSARGIHLPLPENWSDNTLVVFQFTAAEASTH